jgi:lipoprotein-releasing system permease protein
MIALAIFLNVGGWYMLIKIIGSFGRRLKFHQFVAVKHLKGRKSGFLTAIGLLSIVGVSFSSCTLTTVLSVMGGFSNDLKQKILTTNAHIVVDNYGGDLASLNLGRGDLSKLKEMALKAGSAKDVADWKVVLKYIQEMPDVSAATPVIQGEVMINARSNNNGILLKGIETKTFSDVSGALKKLDEGKLSYIDKPDDLFKKTKLMRKGLYKTKRVKPKEDKKDDSLIPAPVLPRQKVLPSLIVGREIAKSLRLYVGEEVNIISPIGDIGPAGPIPRSRPFRVAGTFFSGMYAFDDHYAYTSLKDAQKFFNRGNVISEIHIAIENPEKARIIAGNIKKRLGNKLRVRSWQELNAELFSALKLEKIVMFILMSMAILVASFCIVATLTMLVLEKSSEIAVLMTIGAQSSDIQKIFRFEGILIGIVGTASGLLVGYLLCFSLKHIGLPIPSEVWYIDKLPVNISYLEFMFVGLASLAITTLATVYPTRVASGIRPVEGL